MAESLYPCTDCGLHYTDAETAAACFRHCTTQHACNLEITRHSVERRSAAAASSPNPPNSAPRGVVPA